MGGEASKRCSPCFVFLGNDESKLGCVRFATFLRTHVSHLPSKLIFLFLSFKHNVQGFPLGGTKSRSKSASCFWQRAILATDLFTGTP